MVRAGRSALGSAGSWRAHDPVRRVPMRPRKVESGLANGVAQLRGVSCVRVEDEYQIAAWAGAPAAFRPCAVATIGGLDGLVGCHAQGLKAPLARRAPRASALQCPGLRKADGGSDEAAD
jgi:hypothetical protein